MLSISGAGTSLPSGKAPNPFGGTVPLKATCCNAVQLLNAFCPKWVKVAGNSSHSKRRISNLFNFRKFDI